jgi:hypothetical protein
VQAPIAVDPDKNLENLALEKHSGITSFKNSNIGFFDRRVNQCDLALTSSQNRAKL